MPLEEPSIDGVLITGEIRQTYSIKKYGGRFEGTFDEEPASFLWFTCEDNARNAKKKLGKIDSYNIIQTKAIVVVPSNCNLEVDNKKIKAFIAIQKIDQTLIDFLNSQTAGSGQQSLIIQNIVIDIIKAVLEVEKYGFTVDLSDEKVVIVDRKLKVTCLISNVPNMFKDQCGSLHALMQTVFGKVPHNEETKSFLSDIAVAYSQKTLRCCLSHPILFTVEERYHFPDMALSRIKNRNEDISKNVHAYNNMFPETAWMERFETSSQFPIYEEIYYWRRYKPYKDTAWDMQKFSRNATVHRNDGKYVNSAEEVVADLDNIFPGRLIEPHKFLCFNDLINLNKMRIDGSMLTICTTKIDYAFNDIQTITTSNFLDVWSIILAFLEKLSHFSMELNLAKQELDNNVSMLRKNFNSNKEVFVELLVTGPKEKITKQSCYMAFVSLIRVLDFASRAFETYLQDKSSPEGACRKAYKACSFRKDHSDDNREKYEIWITKAPGKEQFEEMLKYSSDFEEEMKSFVRTCNSLLMDGILRRVMEEIQRMAMGSDPIDTWP